MRLTRFGVPVAATLGVFALVSCASSPGLQDLPRKRVPAETLKDRVVQRTALVLELPQEISYESESEREQPELHPTGFATAAAITTDGYWVSAAHCCPPTSRPRLLWFDVFEAKDLHWVSVHVQPARVVWRGTSREPDEARDAPAFANTDVALLRVVSREQLAFETADLASVASGARVVSAGFGVFTLWGGLEHDLRTSLFRANFCDGPGLVVLGDPWPVRPRGDGGMAGAIVVGGPGLPGDSGGPVVTLTDRLVALVVGGHASGGTVAVAPDWSWTFSLIDADRRSH